MIFTNSDRHYAERVFAALGVTGKFDLIVDAIDQLPDSKPGAAAFRTAFRLAGVSDPHRCVMLDDSTSVTRTAKQLGMFAVLVGKDTVEPDVADLAVESLDQLGVMIGIDE